MRSIKLSATVKDGITSKSKNTSSVRGSTIGSLAQFYHKPYANDWNTSRQKAMEKLKKHPEYDAPLSEKKPKKKKESNDDE